MFQVFPLPTTPTSWVNTSDGEVTVFQANKELVSNAAYTEEEIRPLIEAYIKHRADGFNKESFPPCDYRTIESHLESNPNLQAEKRKLEVAEREGYLEWERMGKNIALGKITGNPTSWIFNMKNKYGWKDRTEVDQNTTIVGKPTIKLDFGGIGEDYKGD